MIRLVLSHPVPAVLLIVRIGSDLWVENLVLAFEGGPFSKVMENLLTDSGNSRQKSVSERILVPLHSDLPLPVAGS